MPPSKGARTFRDPGRWDAVILTDAIDLDGARASGRWLQSDTVREVRP